MTDAGTADRAIPIWNSIAPWRRNLTLGLLFLVAAVSYIDRQIFTLFQDDIKSELGLDDGQLGILTGFSFALFYALAAFPIARYADRGDRSLIIALCVAFWSAATVACGAAASFTQMLLARIGLAAGEAGATPAANSLLVEIFPPNRRVLVISAMLAASAVGLSGGPFSSSSVLRASCSVCSSGCLQPSRARARVRNPSQRSASFVRLKWYASWQVRPRCAGRAC
jgi:MFS family permease